MLNTNFNGPFGDPMNDNGTPKNENFPKATFPRSGNNWPKTSPYGPF